MRQQRQVLRCELPRRRRPCSCRHPRIRPHARVARLNPPTTSPGFFEVRFRDSGGQPFSKSSGIRAGNPLVKVLPAHYTNPVSLPLPTLYMGNVAHLRRWLRSDGTRKARTRARRAEKNDRSRVNDYVVVLCTGYRGFSTYGECKPVRGKSICQPRSLTSSAQQCEREKLPTRIMDVFLLSSYYWDKESFLPFFGATEIVVRTRAIPVVEEQRWRALIGLAIKMCPTHSRW